MIGLARGLWHVRGVALGRLIRPGDILVLGLSLAGVVLAWQASGSAGEDRVVIKQGGQVYAQASLRLNRVIDVPGPLGTTRVEIRDGRVRVLSDPGARQLCVRQGWLDPGEIALCLPNRVAVHRGVVAYDSLNY